MTGIPSFSGFGLGLRKPHYSDFLDHVIDVDFVEVTSENFMIDGGRPLAILDRIRAFYPIALHGLSMSVGSADGVDISYLKRLRRLIDRVDPLFVSDHVSWTRVNGFSAHDLLPLPYSAEALDIICANIHRAQDVIGRAMIFENPPSYISFEGADWSESEFLAEMVRRTGCGLLLDINNIFVSATNNGFDPIRYLEAIPVGSVRQIHLAGHSVRDNLLIDTHDSCVSRTVWGLYAHILPSLGAVATMIERDADIPALTVLLDELEIARALAARPTRAVA